MSGRYVNFRKIKLFFCMKLLIWTSLIYLFFPCCLFGHGELTEQIEQVSERIITMPNNPDLYLQRGQLYAQHLEFEAAQKDYKKTLQLNPQLFITHLLMAQVLAEINQPVSALSAINTFLRTTPNHAFGLITRSGIYQQLQKEKAAEKDLQLVLSNLKTPAPKHYIAIAEACLRADSTNLATALSWLHKGQVQFGFDIVLKEKELSLLVDAKQYSVAIQLIEELLGKFKRQEKWLFKKATIYEQAGQLSAALSTYGQTLQAIENLPKRLQMTKKMLGLETEVLLKIQALTD